MKPSLLKRIRNKLVNVAAELATILFCAFLFTGVGALFGVYVGMWLGGLV